MNSNATHVQKEIQSIQQHIQTLIYSKETSIQKQQLLYNRLEYQLEQLQKDLQQKNPLGGVKKQQLESATILPLVKTEKAKKQSFQSMNKTRNVKAATQSAINLKIPGKPSLQQKSLIQMPEQKKQEQKIVKKGKLNQPFIIPKQIRKDPFVDHPTITKDNVKKGVFYLQNMGMLTKQISQEDSDKLFYNLFSAKRKQLQPFETKKEIDPCAWQNDPNIYNNYNYSRQIQEESLQSLDTTKNRYESPEKLDIVSQKQEADEKEEINLANIKFYYLTIRNYEIDSNDDNYVEIKQYYHEQWGQLQSQLQQLKQIFIQFNIKYAQICMNKLIKLLNYDLTSSKIEQLLECCENSKLLSLIVLKRNQNQQYIAQAAAHKICSLYLIYAAKKIVKNLINKSSIYEKRLKLVQFWVKKFLTKQIIVQKIQKKIEMQKQINQQFKLNWNQIKSKKRYEIHINSLNYSKFQRMTFEQFSQRQNLQVPRIFNITDPNVNIIYVSNFNITDQIVQYYYKMLELGNNLNYKERIIFITPENFDKFPETFCTSKLLYYSPKALKQIKSIIKGNQAYIVPSLPIREDIYLSVQLDVPILQGDFEKTQKYNQIYQAKLLFAELQLPIAPYIPPFQLISENLIIQQLTLQILKYSYSNSFIFKIENETCGRGIAFFNIYGIRRINDLRKQSISEEQVEEMRKVVKELLPKKIKIAMPSLYNNYQEFIEYFIYCGGIIETAPTEKMDLIEQPNIFMRIEPNGDVNVLATYDKLTGTDFINFSCTFPQQSLPSLNTTQLANVIGNKLYENNVFGYVNIGLLAFPDPNSGHPLFWVNNLECQINNYSVGYFAFDFLSKGYYKQNKYYLNTGFDEMINDDDQDFQLNVLEERCYIYIPYIYHIGLQNFTFKEFFFQCRKNKLSFDLDRKQGIVFLMVDEFQYAVQSLLIISDNYKKNIKQLTEAFNFLIQVAGQTVRITDPYDQRRVDSFYLLDNIQKIRNINKHIEHAEKDN